VKLLPVPLRRWVYRIGYLVLQTAWFFTHPRISGVKCVVTHGDGVLLVRHTYGHRQWDLPGGTMEGGEPPIEAARREMREELGVRREDWTSLGQLLMGIGPAWHTLHLFSLELASPEIKLDPGELATSAWFTLELLPPDLSAYVVPIIARAGDQFRVRRPPAAATPTQSSPGACS